MKKIRLSARLSEPVYQILKTWASVHKLTITDALEDLIRSGRASKEVIEKEVIKEVEKYIWIDCQFAQIHCRKDHLVVNPETCWECKRGFKFEIKTEEA